MPLSSTPPISSADASGEACAGAKASSIDLEDETQDHDVAQRAEAGALAQRDPQEQQGARRPGRTQMPVPIAGRFESPWCRTSQGTLPRPEEQDQRRAEAVEDKAGVELEEAASEAGVRVQDMEPWAEVDLYG